MATHKDLSVVLVESSLVVADGWHVLDHNAVVGMLSILVEDVIRFNHIVYDARLGDLLGAKLLLRAQVHPIIVAKMVVAGNGGELDTSADQEVNEGGLHLGLTRLEVITTNKGNVALGELNGSRHKCVLRRSIDERRFLKDARDGENRGWGDLLVPRLDSSHQIVSGIVDTFDDVGVTLSVGSPLDDDFVEIVSVFEVAILLISYVTN